MWRETKQRAEPAISTRPEVGKGTREELDKGTRRGQLEKGDASDQSTPDSRETSRMRESPEQWGKTGQDRLAFLVAL